MSRKYILVILDDFNSYSSIPEALENTICSILELTTENFSTQLFTDSDEDKTELINQVTKLPE